jgi:hypothetical protein
VAALPVHKPVEQFASIVRDGDKRHAEAAGGFARALEGPSPSRRRILAIQIGSVDELRELSGPFICPVAQRGIPRIHSASEKKCVSLATTLFRIKPLGFNSHGRDAPPRLEQLSGLPGAAQELPGNCPFQSQSLSQDAGEQKKRRDEGVGTSVKPADVRRGHPDE